MVLRELALFAGAGGGILGGLLHGWRTVAAVEIDDYPRRILLQRQADGILPQFPIWDDIRTFDGTPWRGLVDVVSGGFPCQDISAAGRGKGLAGERSGLWSEMARIVGEVRPRYVFVENSPMLTGRGLDRVLMDLATLGYDARWGVFGAHTVGAPHQRDRIWVVANAGGGRRREQGAREIQQPRGAGFKCTSENVSDADKTRRNGRTRPGQKPAGRGQSENSGWWHAEPNVGRVANGVAHRVDRIKALGNGQVPAVAALAWEILK